ncbi:MAG TPA: heavy metal translocating P-type ATPase [Propionibacteriaceae bacterium]|nr:heavy metal translocating P-type ATPase [Propionibacteriaceae bacterium]
MPTATTRVVELDIQGMTCASCANRIEKKLNKVADVSASVNYATEKAHVLVPLDLSDAALITVVKNAGYGASLPVADAQPIDRAAQLRTRLIVAIMLSIPVIAMAMVPALQFRGWQWVSFALATPVVWWAGFGFHRSAWVNLRHRATTMDTLISMGTATAWLWSTWALIFGSAGELGLKHRFTWHLMRMDASANIYFEAAVGIITFLLLGRYIEARARREAGSALQALLEMGAREVTVLRSGQEHTLPIALLAVGDEFVVRPGGKVATDGEVVTGFSAVDASLVTGESMPVEVGPGDAVVGATINTTGRLVVRATAVGSDTQLAQIARLVEQAQTGKAHAQLLADKVSGIFVPAVLVLSAFTLISWLLAGEGIGFALSAAIAVLIIACPCALGLATPTALLAGTGRGAQLGIVIRGPEALERAHGVRHLVLDKTGTLTTGHMTVTEVLNPDGEPAGNDILAFAAALESHSEHPIARAVVARASGLTLPEVTEFENVPGRGIRALVDGVPALAGTPILLADAGFAIPASLQSRLDALASEGSTTVLVARGGELLGAIAVNDELRPDAPKVVAALHDRLGLSTALVTGDNAGAAAAMGARAGVGEIRAGALPADKVDFVKALQARGTGGVAMIGDGVNDAAALAQADLGIAMGGGTDAAIAASDITLVRNDLGLLVDAFRLSRATLRTIHANLFWAFAYNVAALPIAAMGLLTPMVAGAAMAFSSVFVVLNSLRLLRFKRS